MWASRPSWWTARWRKPRRRGGWSEERCRAAVRPSTRSLRSLAQDEDHFLWHKEKAPHPEQAKRVEGRSGPEPTNPLSSWNDLRREEGPNGRATPRYHHERRHRADGDDPASRALGAGDPGRR